MKFKKLLSFLANGLWVELYVDDEIRLTSEIENVRKIADSLIEISDLTVKEEGISFYELNVEYAGIYGRKMVKINCSKNKG